MMDLDCLEEQVMDKAKVAVHDCTSAKLMTTVIVKLAYYVGKSVRAQVRDQLTVPIKPIDWDRLVKQIQEAV
jgi:hypothetical protein